MNCTNLLVSICWPGCELQKAINCQQPGHLCSHAVICLSWASAVRSARKASTKSEIRAGAVVFPTSVSLLSLEWLSPASRGTDGKTQGRTVDTYSCFSRHPLELGRKEAFLGSSIHPAGDI